jgi:fibronectin type 3 domain-containing protein
MRAEGGLNWGTWIAEIIAPQRASNLTPNAAPTAPAPPTSLSAAGARRKIVLNWTQSISAGVTQNRVYRSTTSNGGYGLLATTSPGTSYTDAAVTRGMNYYYVVTAVANGLESSFSNPASAKSK